MNIGIYGGSFNPPHLGHLLLANFAMEAFQLDRIFFVPAFVSPFKKEQNLPAADLRGEMVELAVSDNQNFIVDRFEINRMEPSYSVETIRYFRRKFETAQLHLLLGADAFQDFHLWKAPEEILSLTDICVACRPGMHSNQEAHPFVNEAKHFTMPLIEISSKEIRARVKNGKSIQYMVPWAVNTFIEAHGLYR